MLHEDAPGWVPLFPLPASVLFPGTLMPLHVFEPRYVQMTRSLLNRPKDLRELAIALLRENFEPQYGTQAAPIHPVVCRGRLVQSQALESDRYNILVIGVERATIIDENRDLPYRRAQLAPLGSTGTSPSKMTPQNIARIVRLLERGRSLGVIPEALIEAARRVDDHEEFVDCLAFHLMAEPDRLIKQRILEEPGVDTRSDILARWLETALDRERDGDPYPRPLNPN